MFFNIENIMRELTNLKVAYKYLNFSFPGCYLVPSFYYDVVDE
jgi:hypothetical protein